MEQLPSELIDLICQHVSLREMATLSLVDKYFHRLIQQNYFYSFCKNSLSIYIGKQKYKTCCGILVSSINREKISLRLHYWGTYRRCYCEEYNIIQNFTQNFVYFKRFCLLYCLNISMSDTFLVTCWENKLLCAEWLSETYPKIRNNDRRNEFIFRGVCKKGFFIMAKWLVKTIPNIYIRGNSDCAFRWACKYGHLEIAKWLLEICPDIDIRAEKDYAFRWSCTCGRLEIAKWLLEICPSINIRVEKDYAFRHAKKNKQSVIVNWLCQINTAYNAYLPQNWQRTIY